MKLNIDKLHQQEDGMISSQPTSDTLRIKKLERKRSPKENRSISKQNKYQSRQKNRIPIQYEVKFISKVNKEQSYNTNMKEIKKQEFKKEININNEQSKKQKTLLYHRSPETNIKYRNSCHLKNIQINNQYQLLRTYNKQLLANQSKLKEVIHQLENIISQIKDKLQNQTKLNYSQHDNIIGLQLKIINYETILQQKQRIIQQKQNNIQNLTQKITQLQKYIHDMENKKSQKCCTDDFLQSLQGINFQNCTSLNQKQQSVLNDISMEMQYTKIIATLHEKIKYQDIEIRMLKRTREQLLYQCNTKNDTIKVLNQRMKNFFKYTTAVTGKGSRRKNNNCQGYQQDQQDNTLEISIQ